MLKENSQTKECMIPFLGNPRKSRKNLEREKADQWLPRAKGFERMESEERSKQTFLGNREVPPHDNGNGDASGHTDQHSLK